MQESAAARVRQEQRAFFARLAASDGPAPGPADRLDPAYAQLLRLVRLRRGQRIVDLACGVGRPTFAIAARLGPQGSVLGLDLTPACIAAAQARAQELGLHSVTFQLITSEAELPLPPASVDGATCAFGLMYMPAPVRALRALHVALRPGGRVAVSTLASPPPTPAAPCSPRSSAATPAVPSSIRQHQDRSPWARKRCWASLWRRGLRRCTPWLCRKSQR